MGRGLIYEIRRKCQILAYDLTSPEFVSKIYYRYMMGYPLNLKDPKTFNEKIQWLKLYEWPNNPLAVQCGDKYTVRSYLEEKGLGDYLTELIGVWERVEDIPWDTLPEQFAIKVTDGCGYNIICDSKKDLDIPQTTRKLRRWMKEDFGKFNAEPHYSKMKSRILCEEFLSGEMVDYKFFCFMGKVGYMNEISREDGMMNTATFLADGSAAPFRRTGDARVKKNAVLPRYFEKMKEICEIVAKDFPFVRVDFFEINNRIYIGELTFTPNGGLGKMEPMEYERYWGDQIKIDDLIAKRKGK